MWCPIFVSLTSGGRMLNTFLWFVGVLLVFFLVLSCVRSSWYVVWCGWQACHRFPHGQIHRLSVLWVSHVMHFSLFHLAVVWKRLV